MMQTLLTLSGSIFSIAGIWLLLKYVSEHHDKRVQIGALLIFVGMIISGIELPNNGEVIRE